MPKCDFNKGFFQVYSNHISAWVFSSKFAAYFSSVFLKDHPLRNVFQVSKVTQN